MKCVLVVSAVALALSAIPAQARIDCHHDPVCQAKRDGTSVDEARRREGALNGCLRGTGYSQEDWHAYRVPSGAGAKVHACLARHGIREN